MLTLLARKQARSLAWRQPQRLPLAAAAAAGSSVRCASSVDINTAEFQKIARQLEEEQQKEREQAEQQRKQKQQLKIATFISEVAQYAEEQAAKVAHFTPEEIAARNAVRRRKMFQAWREPPAEYYMDVFAEELDILADLESSTPSNDAKPEFDQTLIKAVEEEGEPEPAHSLMSNYSWLGHRSTTVAGIEDLKALLLQAEASLREGTTTSSFERDFYQWLCTIGAASRSEWVDCFSNITCMHAPEGMQERHSRAGLEAVFRNAVRREMALSMAERFAPEEREKDEEIHKFSHLPRGI